MVTKLELSPQVSNELMTLPDDLEENSLGCPREDNQRQAHTRTDSAEQTRSDLDAIISMGFHCGRERLIKFVSETDKKSPSEAVVNFEEACKQWSLSKDAIKALKQEIEGLSKTVVKDDVSIPSGWHVLGFTQTHEVILWEKGRSHRLSSNELRGDNPAMRLLFGLKSSSELGAAIIMQAHEKGLLDVQETMRRGVWRLKDGWGLISGKKVLSYCNDEWCEVAVPVLDGKIVTLEKQPWFNSEWLKNPPYTLEDALSKIIELVSQWKWSAKGDGSTPTQLMAAFLAIAPFQQALKWRPWIYITGAKGTGKSTFFDEVLGRLWGSLAAHIGKTTAHAFAQTVTNSGVIAILDEFEKIKNQEQILELMKLCNSGGVKTSGTPGINAIEHHLRHIPWLGSIYLPKSFSNDSAQMSRTIVFRLERHDGKSPNLPNSQEMEKISASIIAGLIKRWSDIENAVSSIYATKHEQKADGRTVDNVAYALAVLKVSGICEPVIPSWLSEAESKDDGEAILEAILSSVVRLDDGSNGVISDVIQCVLTPSDLNYISHKTAINGLRTNGLSVVEKGGQWFLAMRPQATMFKKLIKDTDFSGLDISEPLKRLPGVLPLVRTAWGTKESKEWAMQIPGTVIEGLSSIKKA